ncbi:hypothetical protein TNCV_3107241 [Trichonephila clavipes]|nr:hypothetical protein TNCV_3107241 [Trichonephila clavipes]
MIEKDDVMCCTMVIVKEDFTPVCNWLLGRVVEVYHGSDGKLAPPLYQLPHHKTGERLSIIPSTWWVFRGTKLELMAMSHYMTHRVGERSGWCGVAVRKEGASSGVEVLRQ